MSSASLSPAIDTLHASTFWPTAATGAVDFLSSSFESALVQSSTLSLTTLLHIHTHTVWAPNRSSIILRLQRQIRNGEGFQKWELSGCLDEVVYEVGGFGQSKWKGDYDIRVFRIRDLAQPRRVPQGGEGCHWGRIDFVALALRVFSLNATPACSWRYILGYFFEFFFLSESSSCSLTPDAC